MKRRGFITDTGRYMTAFSMLPALPGHQLLTRMTQSRKGSQGLKEPDFWDEIAGSFGPSDQFTNLENGYYSPQPTVVLEAHLKSLRDVNSKTSFYMRREKDVNYARTKYLLASFAGCSSDELLITRNATEGLNTVINGLKMKPEDSVLLCNQDYPSAIHQYRQRSKRDGLKISIMDLPNDLSDDEILHLYETRIKEDRPTVLHLTQLIHATGRVMPVKRLAKLARQYNLEVICDGAHAFAHLDFKISDLDVDYFMCSLHKWLCCPFSGLLYIRKEKITRLWPLFGETTYEDKDIRKLERLGTVQPLSFDTLNAAITFHNEMGSKRKQDRLNYLKDYWVNQIADLENVLINTPLEPGRSCAIANFTIAGKSNKSITHHLYTQHNIFTSATDDFPVKGVRVTPHLYTQLEDLDRLIDAIKNIISQ